MNIKGKKRTRALALSGVFAALALALMYVGGISVADVSIVIVCAFLTMILTAETGAAMAWIYASATSVLALLLLPSKLYAIEYLLFGAVYPVLKMYFERIRSPFSMILKISVLDMMLLGLIILAQKVFLAGDDFLSFNFITIAVGTVFFVLFDLCMTSFITLYMVKLRVKLRINKYF